VTGDSLAMMEEAVYSTGFLDFPVSLVAAGVLVSARRAAGAWPFWPAALALLTGARLPPVILCHARRRAGRRVPGVPASDCALSRCPPRPVEGRRRHAPRPPAAAHCLALLQQHQCLPRPFTKPAVPDRGAARARPGYEDCTSGAFRATVECADALRRRRLPALGRLGLPAANLAQAQARRGSAPGHSTAASSLPR
jgi:hypothetical protein